MSYTDNGVLDQGGRFGLKHGPGGRGGPGPCDPDCEKCAAERQEIKRDVDSHVADSIIDREFQLVLRGLDALIGADPERFAAHMRGRWYGQFMLIQGDERRAYSDFKAAALRSQETHQAAQRAMVDLRGCIENLGRVVAPKPE